jgi:nitrate reductase alpha subunit
MLRASQLPGGLNEENNGDWKTLAIDAKIRGHAKRFYRFRWGEGKVNNGEKVGRWNLEAKDGGSVRSIHN